MFTEQPGAPVPADISHLKRPLIGYVGALQQLRLDLDVLRHIAQVHPDWSVVLVGPEDDVFLESDLHSIPNIHFTGHRDPSTLPGYIQAFDVCLNPQIVNEVTIGNYPRKIDEYLAMGKPVVATRTALMSAVFSAHTYLADTKEDYVTLIEKALQEDSPALHEERKRFAGTHSWEAHVDAIYEKIDIVEGN